MGTRRLLAAIGACTMANSMSAQTLKDNDQRLLHISQKACEIAQELTSVIFEIIMQGQSSK